MTVTRLVAVLVASLLLLVARGARAAPDEVLLLTEGSQASSRDAALTAQLLLAARGQLAEIGVQLVALDDELQPSLVASARRARQLSSARAARAVVWFERKPGALLVYVYDPRGPHLYARRVAWDDSLATVSEELAIVLRSAISAIVEGDSIGMAELPLPEPVAEPRPPAPTPAPPPAAPTQPPLGHRLRVGASYVGTLYARAAPWQHGAALSLSLRPAHARWFAGLGYTYFGALSVAEQGLVTKIRRHPGEAFVGAELRLAPVWFIAEGALVVDRLQRSTESVVAEGLSATPDSQRWLWALSTRLGGAVPLGPRLRIVFDVGAEFLLNRFDHVVEGGGESAEIVASPLLARPRLAVGLSVGLW